VISKFSRVDRTGVAVDVRGERSTVTLAVDANRRQQDRGRDIVPTAAEILRLYASFVGEIPYDSFTIAMVEDDRPGGHSPAYFALLNNPPPLLPWLPRQDPAAFNNFPEFYLAHEIAHQWWAIVYNKGAAVLHMLRRLIGDQAFFGGLRRYYSENKFQKAGTEDLQRAMEAEAGQSLTRFFEQWIYASGLPRIRYSTVTAGQELIVRFEQIGEVFDVPVTVTLNYSDRSVDEIVPITEAVVEKRFPLSGSLRNVVINDDHAALGHFDRR